MGASRKTYSFEMVEIWLFDISTIYKIFPIKSRKPIKSLIFLQFEMNLASRPRKSCDECSFHESTYIEITLSFLLKVNAMGCTIKLSLSSNSASML